MACFCVLEVARLLLIFWLTSNPCYVVCVSVMQDSVNAA